MLGRYLSLSKARLIKHQRHIRYIATNASAAAATVSSANGLNVSGKVNENINNKKHESNPRGVLRLSLESLGIKQNSVLTFERKPNASSSATGAEPGARMKSTYLVKNITKVEEFNLQIVELLNVETKMMHIHVDCDDTNNAFAVAFRTPSKTSTGVQHILEHTVLCGSKRYPVRDPFFNMLKRSLNTFMNAMTAVDYTFYPFSTQNQKDFSNLLSVYLDATFFPLLKEQDFQQEGHRLDFQTNPENGTKKLHRTGVVYNEMKGVLSDSSSIFDTHLSKNLFGPESVYGYDSGGDPAVIPNLTYADLKNFHAKHYHPSNAIMVTYGDLPLTAHLQQITDEALCDFTYSQSSYDIQKVFEEEKKILTNRAKSHSASIVTTGPPDAMRDLSKQTKFCNTYMLPQINTSDNYENLVWRVLSSLLFNGPTAPMYKALIDSGKAPEFAPRTGFDASVVGTFSVGAQGIEEKSIKEINDAISEVLQMVSKVGFEDDRVRAAIHQIELSLKHKRSNFGLSVIRSVLSPWVTSNNDAAPKMIVDGFLVNEKIRKLESENKSNPIQLWGDRIKKNLVEKAPVVKITMNPQQDYVQQQNLEESKKLELIEKQLAPDDVQKIIKQNETLKEEREAKQDVSVLPTLSVSDIPKTAMDPVYLSHERITNIDVNPIDAKNRNGIYSRVLNQKTNGVVYSRVMFDASTVPAEYKPYIPLLCSLLGSVNAGDLDYQKLSLQNELYSGGLDFSYHVEPWFGKESASPHISLHRDELSPIKTFPPYREFVLVSQHALEKNLEKALDLLSTICLDSKFDANIERIQTLISSFSHHMGSSITSEPIGYARSLSYLPFGKMFALRENQGGLARVKFTKELESLSKEEIHSLMRTLKDLSELIFRNPSIGLVAGGSGINVPRVDQHHYKFASKFPVRNTLSAKPFIESSIHEKLKKHMIHPIDQNILKAPRNIYIPLPIPVHYCVATLQTGSVSFQSEDNPYLMVLAQILSSNFLHREIREKGGAYGASSSQDALGYFSFSTWYDPNTVESYKALERGFEWLRNGEFSSRDVDEALLSVFADVDRPQSPSQKGYRELMYGVTPDMRERNRSRFLSCTKDKLVEAANKYFNPAQGNIDFITSDPSKQNNRITSVIAGSEQSLSQFPNWQVKQTSS